MRVGAYRCKSVPLTVGAPSRLLVPSKRARIVQLYCPTQADAHSDVYISTRRAGCFTSERAELPSGRDRRIPLDAGQSLWATNNSKGAVYLSVESWYQEPHVSESGTIEPEED
jgi:hypothetical protein